MLMGLCMCVLEIGAVRAYPRACGPPRPAGRGGHLHISVVQCWCGPMILIAERVRAPALSVTAGLCGHV